MATHKETLAALSNESERLTRSLHDASYGVASSNYSMSSAIHSLEGTVDRSLTRHGDRQVEATNSLAQGLAKASINLIGTVVAGGALFLFGAAIAAFIERLREINKKSELIRSIQWLRKRHPDLSYEFMVERSNASGATKDERQTILNELIHEEIATVVQANTGESVVSREDNPRLEEYWHWIESIRENALKEQCRLKSTQSPRAAAIVWLRPNRP